MKFESLCPLCGSVKKYSSEHSYKKCKDKNCKSCSNSLKAGGAGKTDKCFDCGEEKDYEKSSSLCKRCHNKRSARYITQTYRFKKYGVSRKWYEEEVKNGCAICGVKLDAYSLNKRERGHIDHCHETGKTRGVLCDLCNKGLGHFKDSIENLNKAIEYLRRI
jgi:hypothetical protein